MKLLISGSRKYNNYEELQRIVTEYRIHCALLYGEDVDTILHGGAAGADALASEYAKQNFLTEKVIKPNYENHYHKIAPLARNAKMVAEADVVLCFYRNEQRGGTLDTAKKAITAGKMTWEVLHGKVTQQAPKITLGLLSLTL
jgi:hypothetical protein